MIRLWRCRRWECNTPWKEELLHCPTFIRIKMIFFSRFYIHKPRVWRSRTCFRALRFLKSCTVEIQDMQRFNHYTFLLHSPLTSRRQWFWYCQNLQYTQTPPCPRSPMNPFAENSWHVYDLTSGRGMIRKYLKWLCWKPFHLCSLDKGPWPLLLSIEHTDLGCPRWFWWPESMRHSLRSHYRIPHNHWKHVEFSIKPFDFFSPWGVDRSNNVHNLCPCPRLVCLIKKYVSCFFWKYFLSLTLKHKTEESIKEEEEIKKQNMMRIIRYII